MKLIERIKKATQERDALIPPKVIVQNIRGDQCELKLDDHARIFIAGSWFEVAEAKKIRDWITSIIEE